jgi:SAM-dependent methyltransferase
VWPFFTPKKYISSFLLNDHLHKIIYTPGDITSIELPMNRFDIWHDRAVFHFLINPADRHAYIERVMRAVRPGGYVIIATFAEDVPEKCSGLP